MEIMVLIIKIKRKIMNTNKIETGLFEIDFETGKLVKNAAF